MRVGIVTVYDSANLGSFLQALAMQEIVKKNGDIAYIIKTRSIFSTFCVFCGFNNLVYNNKIKMILALMRYCILNSKKCIIGLKKYKAYKKDWLKFDNIISPKKVSKLHLDVILYGSDEIWNVNQLSFQNPYFYGFGINADKKIAYAVSVGTASSQQIDRYPNLLDGIKNLDAVFYRDEHTKEALLGKNVRIFDIMCDPTLQIDICKYMKSEKYVNVPDCEYIAIYSYLMSEKNILMIQKFAEEHSLKTVAVSLQQPWCDIYINCSPLELGAILKNAKYVFTSTFHGAIFSALYHKNFVVFPAYEKVKDVINTLNLNNHLISNDYSYEEFCELLKYDYDYKATENIIRNLRNNSCLKYNKFVVKKGD